MKVKINMDVVEAGINVVSSEMVYYTLTSFRRL